MTPNKKYGKSQKNLENYFYFILLPDFSKWQLQKVVQLERGKGSLTTLCAGNLFLAERNKEFKQFAVIFAKAHQQHIGRCQLYNIVRLFVLYPYKDKCR
jgi:hypothetical protein